MKRVLFILLTGSLLTVLCSAQYTPEPEQKASNLATSSTITGTIESVSLGDPVKNMKPEIIVVDEDGERVILEIKTNTAIYTKICSGLRVSDGKISCLNDVTAGDKVYVEYMTTKTDARKVLTMTVFKQ